MYIRFSASKEIKAIAEVVKTGIEDASACPANAGVSRHRSSDQQTKENKSTGIIAHNH